MNYLVVIVGPSCSGKTTLAQRMAEEYRYAKVVTTTTRAPRDGEVDGVDYYFITKKDFAEKVAAGMFVEHAVYGDNYYGISKDALNEAFRKGNGYAVSVNEIAGWQALSAINYACDAGADAYSVTGIFLDAPYPTLIERLAQRGVDPSSVRFSNLVAERQIFSQITRSKQDYVRALYHPTQKQITTFLRSFVPFDATAMRRELSFYTNAPMRVQG